MTSPGRMTWAGALATAATACSLIPLISGKGWYWPPLGAIVVVAGAGWLSRRLRAAQLVVVAAELIALMWYLTVLFVPSSTMGRVIPGPKTILALDDVLRDGVADIHRYPTPAPATVGIIAIIVLIVGGVAIAVDILTVTLGRASLAGFPLLLLYSVPATMSRSRAIVVSFVLAGAAYLVLLLIEERERLKRWGPVLTPEANNSVRQSIGKDRGAASGNTMFTSTGYRIGAAALSISVIVPLLIPGLAGGLFFSSRVNPTESNRSGTIVAVNPVLNMRRDLEQPQNIPLMRVSTSAESPYLRLVTLDDFTGDQWLPATRPVFAVPQQLPPPAGLTKEVAQTPIRTNITLVHDLAAQWLPMPYPTSRVNMSGNWRFQPEGRYLVAEQGPLKAGFSYGVTSLDVIPTLQQLEAAPPPPEQLRQYTKLPDDLPPLIGKLARQVTSGGNTPYEKARRLQEWFRNSKEFRYSLAVKPGNGSSAIAEFLTDRAGYCEQFAGTMAVMARALGIPARVNVGFAPGQPQDDGSYLVGTSQAHAWPELFFSGVGWMSFEPTPVTDSPGGTPTWVRQDIPGNNQPSSPPAETASPENSPSSRDGASSATGPSGSIPPGVVIAGLLLGVLLAMPMLIRQGIRQHRLANAPDPHIRVARAWAELRDCMRDLGYPWHDAQTPRQLVDQLTAQAELPPAATAALARLAATVEQARYAPALGEVGNPGYDVDTVWAALLRRISRWQRWRARLFPASTVVLLGLVARQVFQVRNWATQAWARIRPVLSR